MKYQIILASLLLIFTQAINIVLSKRNVFVEQGSRYICGIQIERQNAELIPTTLSFSNQISNTIPTEGSYFDFFSFLDSRDVQCYNEAVNNQSYLFPCPFLESRYSQLRTSQAQNTKVSQQIEEVNDFQYAYVVDNSPFPYPQGASTYSSINIDVITNLQIVVSTSYENLGKRLIYINVTAFLIFLVIFLILVCKTKIIERKMDSSKLDMQLPNNVMLGHLEDKDSFIDEHDEMEPSAFGMKLQKQSVITESVHNENYQPIQRRGSIIDSNLSS